MLAYRNTRSVLGSVELAWEGRAQPLEDAPRWIFVTNSSLLCVYCIELSARLFVFRRYFFFSPWHLLDFTIIGVDVALLILQGLIGDLPNLAVLRILRLVRLARAVRTFPELRTMMLGLAGTVKTVFWGILLLGAIIIFFSLVAVQLVHPINSKLDYDGCERCPRAYQSVWYAFCTLVQQVVAGDAWGTATLPVIEEAPWAFLFFFGILVTVNLLVINLILAVIVEKAQEVHEQQTQEVVKRQAAKKEVEVKKAKIELCKLCYAMDEDKSGNLTLDELLKGYDGNGYFANLLKSMDITRDDLKMVFNILDKEWRCTALRSLFRLPFRFCWRPVKMAPAQVEHGPPRLFGRSRVDVPISGFCSVRGPIGDSFALVWTGQRPLYSTTVELRR